MKCVWQYLEKSSKPIRNMKCSWARSISAAFRKRICLEYVPEVRIGEYVLVHVGFALSVIDEQEAKYVFSYLREMKELDDLTADEPASG